MPSRDISNNNLQAVIVPHEMRVQGHGVQFK